jgi:hypothetical protein
MNADSSNRKANYVANALTAANPGGANPGLEVKHHSFARQSAALYRALCSVVREADIEALARKLMEMALAGDMAAMKLLLAYVMAPRS